MRSTGPRGSFSLCDASLSRSEGKTFVMCVCNVRVCAYRMKTVDDSPPQYKNHLCQNVKGLQWGACCMSSCVKQQCVIVLSHACRGEMAAKCAAASIDCSQARHGAQAHTVSIQGTLFIHNIKHDKKPNKQNQLTKIALSYSYKASCNVKAHSPLCRSSISVKPTGVKTK